MNQVKVTKVQIKNFLKNKLATSEIWAKRALIKIYENQTEDEQTAEYTKYSNDIGFSGVDSEFLTSLAKQLIRKRYLTQKQMSYVFKHIPKYWNQILAISDQEKLYWFFWCGF